MPNPLSFRNVTSQVLIAAFGTSFLADFVIQSPCVLLRRHTYYSAPRFKSIFRNHVLPSVKYAWAANSHFKQIVSNFTTLTSYQVIGMFSGEQLGPQILHFERKTICAIPFPPSITELEISRVGLVDLNSFLATDFAAHNGPLFYPT